MSGRPTTSVVICTHNMVGTLPGAVRSVFEQTTRDWELIVLDDGSDDGTWEYLQTLRHKRGVRIYRNANQRGLAACRNFLLQKSRGYYLSILDADDCLAPSKLLDHQKVLEESHEIGLVWGWALVMERNRLLRVPPRDFELSWDLVTPYGAAHSATTWRKSFVERVGGYRSEYSLIEAVDLYFRVGDFSRQVYLPKLAVLKRVQWQSRFRRKLRIQGDALSKLVLHEAIYRRYGVAF